MALPIQVNPKDPCIDIHTGRGQGSCTFANGFNCVCSCAGIAHAQLLRMVLTPENSKKLPDKYKQALANKVQTVQARIADIPHDKVTTIIHAQKQPKRVFFLCEDVSHPIIDYCRVIDILRWARENPLASQQVSKLCTCVQNHGINYIETPKTKSGTRQVPLSKETIQAFQRVIKKRPKAKPFVIDGRSNFLFVNQKGKPKVAIDYSTLFVRMVKKYNKHHKDNPLPHITPHTLRHTFCTRLASKNMNPKDLQYIMGHSNISITMNWYAHASIDTAKSEVQRLIA